MVSGKYVRIVIGYLSRTISSNAWVSSGSRPVSNVKTSMPGAFSAMASSKTISSTPKLHANAAGDRVRSIRLRCVISPRVLPARSSITTLTSNHASDTHREKHASQNAAHHHLWQPAADCAPDIDTGNRTQQQADEKTIIDIPKLEMSKPRDRHERDRVSQVRADNLPATQLGIEQHEGSNADRSGSNRLQRYHDSQNDPNNHGETVGCLFAQFKQLPTSRYDPFPQ